MNASAFTSDELDQIRDEFPILKREIKGRPLVYLDNAATSQSPRCVLEASRTYYESYNANIHRGVHRLAQEATAAYEGARDTIATHFNCQREEVIFTSGTTDGINLVSGILGRAKYLKAGDEILISALEHHSNIVPWRLLADEVGAILKVIPLTADEVWDIDAAKALITERTKIVALSHVSNAIGIINPIESLISLAKEQGAITLVDAAQSAPHFPLDFQQMGADFIVFSGHKMYAPTGIGVLLGRRELMETLPPYRGGGEMIKQVTFDQITYNDLPGKYEAGTPNIEGVIALGEAINFINRIGLSKIQAHESELSTYLESQLSKREGIRIYAAGAKKAGAVSFAVDAIHHYDLGTLLDQFGVAVRTGHHCCQPLMQCLNITGTVRASFGVYNSLEEIDQLLAALDKSRQMLL